MQIKQYNNFCQVKRNKSEVATRSRPSRHVLVTEKAEELTIFSWICCFQDLGDELNYFYLDT